MLFEHMIRAFYADLFGRVESMMVMKTIVLACFNLPWNWELITLILSSRYLFTATYILLKRGSHDLTKKKIMEAAQLVELE